MCGIVASYHVDIGPAVAALRHRGPDAEGIVNVGGISLGHTRLAILDLDPRSNQPFVYGNVTLVYNGELWNYRELRRDLEAAGRIFTTAGDTEVVAVALDTWGADALPRFNGMFALAWTDDGTTLYLTRDRFGEIPLHISKQWPFTAASEIKGLLALGIHPKSIEFLSPATLLIVTPDGMTKHCWHHSDLRERPVTRAIAAQELRSAIEQGARERAISDVPACTLLSGGIDSAAVAVYLAEYVPNLVAYTAVHDPQSRDLREARGVAEMLNIPLVEVAVPAPARDDLRRVIQHIEMPYKAQIEIGWACLKLAERMAHDGFKVTFSGEGSDELWASYGFSYHALKTQNWHQYRHDLFLGQHRKNFARCNKIFMAHGVECRLPFLHPPLVELALSLPKDAVRSEYQDKAVMSEAMAGLLGTSVTGRSKVAFQDGMGIKDAIAQRLPDPRRFYNVEYNQLYN